MASEKSSITFQENPRDDAESIQFDVNESQPNTINPRADRQTDTSSIAFEVKGSLPPTAHTRDDAESIQFDVNESQPNTINPRQTDTDSIAFDVAPSLPPTANARDASAPAASEGEIQFNVEGSIPAASRTHESVEFQVLDGATQPSVGEDALVITEEPVANEHGEQYPVAAHPPPRRLSSRAAAAATTPRGDGRPQTPRLRSPTSSHRPQPGDGYPGDEEEEEVTGHSSHPSSHHSINDTQPPRNGAKALGEEYSDAGEEDFADVAPTAAARAAPPLPAPTSAAMVVTTHTRHFDGDKWADIVANSHDTLERTITKETAQALNIDDQFLRVSNITAGADGLTAEISIVHDPDALPEEEVTTKIEAYPYESTRLLHDMRTAKGENQAYGLGAALQNTVAGASSSSSSDSDDEDEEAPAHSFTTMMGDGAMLLIDYSVPMAGEVAHMELFFEGSVADMKVKFIKHYVSEYARVPVQELSVRYGGEEVSDSAKGSGLGWMNGSVLKVIRTPKGASKTSRRASSSKRKASKAGTEDKASEAKKADTPAKKKKTAKKAANEKDEAAPTEKKKKTKKGKKSAKKAGAAKKQKGTKKAGAKKTKAAKKGKKTTKKGKKTTTPRQSGAGSAPASPRKYPTPAPHYLSTTASRTEHNVSHERAIPDVITVPRVFTPRTPRPGADRLPYAPAPQYEAAPLPVEDHDGSQPQARATTPSGRRSRSRPTTPRSSTPTARGRRASQSTVGGPASHPREAPSSPSAQREASVPPQRVARSVLPTTPRSAVRPMIFGARTAAAAPTAAGAAVGASDTISVGDTPSVSRRSHSPYRAAPQPMPPTQTAANRYAELESPAEAVAVPAPEAYHPYMDVENLTPQSQGREGYDIDYEIECMGEPAGEPVPADAPNPFI